MNANGFRQSRVGLNHPFVPAESGDPAFGQVLGRQVLGRQVLGRQVLGRGSKRSSLQRSVILLKVTPMRLSRAMRLLPVLAALLLPATLFGAAPSEPPG